MDKSKLKRLCMGEEEEEEEEDMSTTEINSVYRSPAMKKMKRCYRKSNSGEDISTELLPVPLPLPPSVSTGEDICSILPLISVKKSNQPHPDQMEMETEMEMDKSRRAPPISFGEDIITEILLRLPVKSLVKFKSVSKLWLSIVSSRRFREIYVSAAATDHLFFKFDRSSFLRVLPNKPEVGCFVPSVVKRPDYYGTLTWASSCNGLLLLKSSNSEHSVDNKYYVYNPTTDEYKFIDLPPRITENKYVCATLAFDPNESLRNKIIYKIIFLCRPKQCSSKFRLEVYSSTTGICKASEAPVIHNPVGDFDYHLVGDFDYHLVGDFYYHDNHGFFWNSAIHWLNIYGTTLAYFNVHAECINELQTPCLNRLTTVRFFGESQDHLHLVNSEQYFYKSSVFYVNELKKDYSGWFLKYKVELASIISAFPRIIQDEEEDGYDCYGNFISINQDEKANDYYQTFMSIIRDKEEDGDDSTMVLVACGEWVEYNFKKKTTRRICNFMLPKLSTSLSPWGYRFYIHQFIPTLTWI